MRPLQERKLYVLSSLIQRSVHYHRHHHHHHHHHCHFHHHGKNIPSFIAGKRYSPTALFSTSTSTSTSSSSWSFPRPPPPPSNEEVKKNGLPFLKRIINHAEKEQQQSRNGSSNDDVIIKPFVIEGWPEQQQQHEQHVIQNSTTTTTATATKKDNVHRQNHSRPTFTYSQVLEKTLCIYHYLIENHTTTSSTTYSNSPFIAHLTLPGSDYIACQWSCYAYGKASVPLAISHPTPELKHVLQDCNPCYILASPYAPNYHQLLQAVDELKMSSRLISNVHEITNNNVQRQQSSTSLGVDAFQELLVGDQQSTVVERPTLDTPALLMYTSGTTGKPKGVVHTHRSLYHQITDLVTAWQWQSSDVAIHVLPLHHVHGVVNILSCAAYAGSQVQFERFHAINLWHQWAAQHNNDVDDGNNNVVVVDDGHHHHRSSNNTLDKPTVFMAVPTIYAKLLEASTEEEQVPSYIVQEAVQKTLKPMRLQVSGSAALPISILERWKSLTGHTLLERYGMTEFAMALSNPYLVDDDFDDDDDDDGDDKALQNEQGMTRRRTTEKKQLRHRRRSRRRRHPGHVGLPLPSATVRLVDSNDPTQIITTPNTPGNLQVRGPILFQKYWNRPEETEKAFVRVVASSSSSNNNNNNNDDTKKSNSINEKDDNDNGVNEEGEGEGEEDDDYGYYFDTGDVAQYNDSLDSYQILGRASVDILKVGGYKVSALEIERELLQHPNILEVVIVGIDDDDDDDDDSANQSEEDVKNLPIWGQQIGMIARYDDNDNKNSNTNDQKVQDNISNPLSLSSSSSSSTISTPPPPPPPSLSLSDIRGWCKSRLANYKIPTKLLWVNEIPKNAMGKVNKKELVHLFNK